LAENIFNVYLEDEHQKSHLVLKNAELIKNKEKENEIIIRTDTEQFRVPYLKDKENNVYCMDSEGAPLKLVISIHSNSFFIAPQKRRALI